MVQLDELIKELKRLVENNPDFVYESVGYEYNCYYTKGGLQWGRAFLAQKTNCNGCLFGQALMNLYPELKEQLEEFDKRLFGVRIDGVLENIGYKGDRKLLDKLRIIQDKQDRGVKWGELKKDIEELL